MFQQKIADVVKVCDKFINSSVNAVLGTSTPINEISFYNRDSTFTATQIVIDAPDNSLFTFDFHKVGLSDAREAAFVFTYVATEPLDLITLAQVSNVMVSRRITPDVVNSNTLHSISGAAVIPKLPRSDGELQYVGVGLFGGNWTGVGSLSGHLRVHTEEIQFFQPSK